MEQNANRNAYKQPIGILVIDDEENMRHMLSELLTTYGYRAETAENGEDGIEKIQKVHYDIVFCDLKMPQMGGLEFLSTKAKMGFEAPVIIMSAYGTIDMAVEAMKLGAYDFIAKPFKSDQIRHVIKKIEEHQSLRKENIRLKEQIKKIGDQYDFLKMIGKSESMRDVFKLALKVAQFNTTVLITGESGTGKELIARGIHFSSHRVGQSFIPLNCGGIPENLLESELFGYVKGAFTGAERERKGLFLEADGGTIFLDEIGELPLTLQVKLLRILQDNEVRPIGGSKTKKVDVRVLSATSRNLEEEIKKGNFREDLYYRLNVFQIKLPPLRERIEDIPLLCQHFIQKFNKSLRTKIEGISPRAMTLILNYLWPGNVRELENAIERAMVLSEDPILSPKSFNLELNQDFLTHSKNNSTEGYSLKSAQRMLETRMIRKALNATKNNRTRAAKLLEISHPSLLNKIKLYDIDLRKHDTD